MLTKINVIRDTILECVLSGGKTFTLGPEDSPENFPNFCTLENNEKEIITTKKDELLNDTMLQEFLDMPLSQRFIYTESEVVQYYPLEEQDNQ